ncbi:hypothetical protein Dimus_037665, partial [Dionaea muscipula]
RASCESKNTITVTVVSSREAPSNKLKAHAAIGLDEQAEADDQQKLGEHHPQRQWLRLASDHLLQPSDGSAATTTSSNEQLATSEHLLLQPDGKISSPSFRARYRQEISVDGRAV